MPPENANVAPTSRLTVHGFNLLLIGRVQEVVRVVALVPLQQPCRDSGSLPLYGQQRRARQSYRGSPDRETLREIAK